MNGFFHLQVNKKVTCDHCQFWLYNALSRFWSFDSLEIAGRKAGVCTRHSRSHWRDKLSDQIFVSINEEVQDESVVVFTIFNFSCNEFVPKSRGDE